MDTQQKHSYHEFIENFSFLFKEIKEKDENLLSNEIRKEDESIYNVVVGFNTVKFLTEHANWNWDEDENKNKAYEVIPPEWNKIKKAEQKLESEVKAKLQEYVDDVAGVSIYGNHASITLGDDKKEFKISEFLNSDFCEKNGISGFSTLHSDGKSGMHGFVAEEEGKKIRHYVVTDGSYEMTLKWYAEGKECEIKIKIDANGVDLVKGDDFSLERLEANRDVKIGGLFLHEIEFREKGQGKANEIKESSETFIESNSKNIGIQTHRTLQSNSRRQSYDSGIGKDFDDKINSQEAEEKRELRQAARKANSGDQVYNLQSLFEENSQNKRTPPPLPPRTSSLKKDVFDEQGSGSRKPDRSEQIPNNQQQPEIPQQESNSGDIEQEVRNFKKNNLRHTDVDDREASIAGGRKNNPSPLETLKNRIPFSPSSDPDIYNGNNQVASDAEWKESEQPLSASALNNKSDSGYSSQIHAQPQVDPKQPKRSLENIEQSDQTPLENLLKEIRDRSQQDNRGLRKVDPTDKLSQDKEDGLQKNDLADVKTVVGPTVSVSASTPNSISDSGYSSPINNNNEQSQVDPGQLKASLMNVEQRDDTLLTEFTSKLDKETHKFPLRPVDQKGISEQTKEHLSEAGLLKDSSTDVKTNDSGYSSPINNNNEQSQVDPGQLKKCLENIKPKEIGDTSELKEALEKLDKGLREPAQQATKENIPKDSFSESVLEKIKEGKQYDPIRELLKNKIGSQDNIITAATELGTVLSELCTEAQKGFAKREEEKRFAKDEQKTRG